MKRTTRYRLLVPLQRGARNPPEHTARAVAIGLGWSLTPFVGIQMMTVFACWLIARRIFAWNFSLIIALAWTWVTNVATLVPAYYLFFITGQLLLGQWSGLKGYAGFAAHWQGEVGAETSWWAQTEALLNVLGGWGLAMLVGCIPYALLGGWLGYRWSLAFVIRYRAARQVRVERRRQRGTTIGGAGNEHA